MEDRRVVPEPAGPECRCKEDGSPVGTRSSPWRRFGAGEKGLATAAVLAAATVAAYANSFQGRFQFDDYTVIVENPAVRGLAAWVDSMPGIRPFLKFSYALNRSSGLGLAGFHTVNLACHLAAVLLAFYLCRRLAGSSQRLAPLAEPIAIAAGLVFALHPVQTEAVTYISGRSVSLMGACYLGSVCAHLEARSSRWLSLLLFGLALATKETAATLPLALVLVNRAIGGSWAAAWRRTVPHWLLLATAVAAGIAIPGYRSFFVFSFSVRSVAENLLTQVTGISYLLTEPLLLLRTNIDPGLAAKPALTFGLFAQAGVLLALLLSGPILLHLRPVVGAAIVWFFLHLAPTNSILPRLDVANDRQLYLALLGPAFLLAAAVWSWSPPRLAKAAIGGLAVVLLTATCLRNDDYRSEIALWASSVAASPANSRAWNNLGFAYEAEGRTLEAKTSYRRALALDPRRFRAHWNLERLEGDARAPALSER